MKIQVMVVRSDAIGYLHYMVSQP